MGLISTSWEYAEPLLWLLVVLVVIAGVLLILDRRLP